jgi:hypothetical protein
MILQSVAAAPLTATFFVEYAIDYLKENLPEDATKYEAILRQLLQQQQQMMMLQMQQQAANPQQEQPNNEPNSNLQ